MTKSLERMTDTGAVVRLMVEALDDNRIRILECYRKPQRNQRFKRAEDEEGAILFFEQLETDESFEDFFALKEAA